MIVPTGQASCVHLAWQIAWAAKPRVASPDPQRRSLPMSADPVVLGAFIVGPLLSFGIYGSAASPQNYYAATTNVEKLYKEDGRVVTTPVMDAAAAEKACPNGNQVARQTARTDGTREYLVWQLRCR